MPHLTVAEKLAEIENLIELHRWTRRFPKDPEYRTYVALKMIAKDLRARLDGKAEATRRELGSKVASAVRKADADSDVFNHALLELAKDVIGHWPTVEQALEQYEKTHALA